MCEVFLTRNVLMQQPVASDLVPHSRLESSCRFQGVCIKAMSFYLLHHKKNLSHLS